MGDEGVRDVETSLEIDVENLVPERHDGWIVECRPPGDARVVDKNVQTAETREYINGKFGNGTAVRDIERMRFRQTTLRREVSCQILGPGHVDVREDQPGAMRRHS